MLIGATMNLRSINLNLLKTLHVLLETRSVTVASRELFLTQPAVSASLKQLREIFDDKLLTKGNDGLLELTHHAKLIKPKLSALLKQTENLLGMDVEIALPETLEDTFHLGIHNHVSALIIPKLYQALNKIAPLIKIKQTDVSDLSELSAKELHQFDFLIGSFRAIPKSYCHEHYFSDQFVCLSGNQTLNKKSHITIKDLNNSEHVILSYLNNYTRTFSEKLLVSKGVQRKYKMIVSDASLAVQLAAAQSLLLIIMRKHAELLNNHFSNKIFSLPFHSTDLNTEILYKEIGVDNPAKQWFKSILFALIK